MDSSYSALLCLCQSCPRLYGTYTFIRGEDALFPYWERLQVLPELPTWQNRATGYSPSMAQNRLRRLLRLDPVLPSALLRRTKNPFQNRQKEHPHPFITTKPVCSPRITLSIASRTYCLAIFASSHSFYKHVLYDSRAGARSMSTNDLP